MLFNLNLPATLIPKPVLSALQTGDSFLDLSKLNCDGRVRYLVVFLLGQPWEPRVTHRIIEENSEKSNLRSMNWKIYQVNYDQSIHSSAAPEATLWKPFERKLDGIEPPCVGL